MKVIIIRWILEFYWIFSKLFFQISFQSNVGG